MPTRSEKLRRRADRDSAASCGWEEAQGCGATANGNDNDNDKGALRRDMHAALYNRVGETFKLLHARGRGGGTQDRRAR